MKKILSIVCSVTLLAASLSGCSSKTGETPANNETTAQETTENVNTNEQDKADSSTEETTEASADKASSEEDIVSDESEESTDTATDEETQEATEVESKAVTVRVGSLKGPTTMGLVNLMKDSESGITEGSYEFDMKTQPDEIMAGIVAGDIDVALVPANMASVLYNKTEGGVSLVDINTLGVLYCVTGDDSITSVKDLSGKTVVTTGQGASPEYVLRYLLDKNGITDCEIEFKSEATEIAAILQEDPSKVAILPQPFVTVATAKNDALKVAFSLTDEWDAVSDGSKLLTGVTVVRNDFLNENPDAVKTFITEHENSTKKALDDIDGTAELVAEYGIIEKPEIAKKALPECNIVCISGDEAKTALEGYLQVLFEQDPKSVGGSLPDDAFYSLD